MRKMLLLTGAALLSLGTTGVFAEEAKMADTAAPAVAEAPKADAAEAAKPAKKMKKKHHKNAHHARHHSEADALRAQVANLTQRLDQLERVERAKPSDQEAITDGNSLRLKLTGQVNRAVMWQDDGRNSATKHVDNDMQSSRINLTATGKLTDDMDVGATIEAQFSVDSSAQVDVRDHSSASSTGTWSNRIMEVFFDSKRFGKVSAGLGSMASDGTMEDTDMSLTTVVANGSDVGRFAGGTVFFDKTLNGKWSNTALAGGANGLAVNEGVSSLNGSVGQFFNNADGLSRQNRIRYGTPEYYGFRMDLSHAYADNNGNSSAGANPGRGNDMWDAALRYAGEIGCTKIAAQIAYVHDNTVAQLTSAGAATNLVTGYDQVNGSIGVLFPVGISFMVAAANRDWDFRGAPDAKMYFAKLGYQHSFFEAGKTAFAIDFGNYERFTFKPTVQRNKFRGRTYGAFMVQHLDRVATELYIGGRAYVLREKGVAPSRFKHVTAFMAGARVKF